MLSENYRAPNCFRTRLHVAAQHSCADCEFVKACPFGFNVNHRPVVNEMRVDFAGNGSCNLDCRLCWAKTWESGVKAFGSSEIVERLSCCLNRLSSSMNGLVASGRIRKPGYFAFSDLQVTGGEPLLTGRRAGHLVEVIIALDHLLEEEPQLMGLFKTRKTGPFSGRARVRIFTNGISLGKGQVGQEHLGELGALRNVHVDAMVSLKGTTQCEFAALQGHRWSPGCGTHSDQVNGVIALKELEETLGTGCLSVNLVLGMYHSHSYDIRVDDGLGKPAFSSWSKDLQRIVARYFADGSCVFVEPVKNPYAGRDRDEAARWEREMSDLIRSPGTLEPTLKKGRGRRMTDTRIASVPLRRSLGGSEDD